MENCPDVTNCDLLDHCISLGQDKGETLSLGRIPCREDQDGQGGFFLSGPRRRKKMGSIFQPLPVYKGYEAAKLARIKVLNLN